MKKYQAQTPQNLALIEILPKFRKTSTPLVKSFLQIHIHDLYFQIQQYTGQFTVPRGGAGLYLFYTNFYGGEQEYAYFRIRTNCQGVCAAFADINNSATDNGAPSCAGVTILTEGTFRPLTQKAPYQWR